MPRPKGSTRIHQLGLADEITSLVRIRWPAGKIAEYVKAKHNIELRNTEIWYFREEFVSPEEILPPQSVQQMMCAKAAVIDIVAERATLIELQKDRVQRMLEQDQHYRSSEQSTERDDLSRGIQMLSRLLDAYRKDLFDLGLLRLGITASEVSNYSTEGRLRLMSRIENELVAMGMDPKQASTAVMIGAYGRERLGLGPDRQPDEPPLA